MIKDARHMIRGAKVDFTATDAGQAERLDQFYRIELLKRGFTEQRSDIVITAYVNQGRWVANCQNCNGGIACWEGLKRGVCLDCGFSYPVAWPTQVKQHRAIEALDRRPEVFRNWFPWSETPKDLEAENKLNQVGD